MGYLYLAIAIIFEVIGTSFLKSTENFTKWIPTVVVLISYGIAFYLMTFAIKTIPVGIVYAIWSACGIVLTAAVAYLFFNQKLDLAAILGMSFIIVGVVVINVFSKSTSH